MPLDLILVESGVLERLAWGGAALETVLLRLAWASLQALPLTAVVWAMCRYANGLSASARCTLWWLATAQLVLGLLWPTPLELPLLPASDVGALAAPAMAGGTTMFAAANESGGDIAPQPLRIGLIVMGALWTLGLAAMSFRTFLAWRQTRDRVRRSRPCGTPSVASAYQLACERTGARAVRSRMPELRWSDEIESPLLSGGWRPVLLMPRGRTDAMDADELDMALRHELAHFRRGDLWWGLVPALAQHLFFFHPLAHFAAREYALAREAACDAAVLADGRHAPQDYGRLLLRLGVMPRPTAGVASASATFTVLKRRLTMLRTASSRSHTGALLAAVAVVALGMLPYRVTASSAVRDGLPFSPWPRAATARTDDPFVSRRSAKTVAAASESAPARRTVTSTQVDRDGVTTTTYERSGDDSRFVEINDGARREWVQRNGTFFEIKNGREEEVRDAATVRRLEARQQDAAKAEAQGRIARRDAERARHQADVARREADLRRQEARRNVEQARRDMQEARRQGEQSVRDAEQAVRDAEQAARHQEQSARDAEQARRDIDQARRNAEQAQREAEHAKREAARNRGSVG